MIVVLSMSFPVSLRCKCSYISLFCTCAVQRKISWSDEVGKLPLERLAPVAYVSDTEGDDEEDEYASASVRRAPAVPLSSMYMW